MSPIDVAVAFCAALAGAAAFEPIRAAYGAFRARKAPLRRWYWQVTYRTADASWRQLWSIELVKVRRHGDRVYGTMYRVYPTRFRRRWTFVGELHEGRHLSLVYHSVGEDYGANGTVNLGVLNRWLWCGAFQQIPDAERGAELQRQKPERRETRRIGPDFTEESLIEWIAADSHSNDQVRGFLASIPSDSPAAPAQVARYLPAAAQRVLTEAPPFHSWIARGFEAAIAPISLIPIFTGEQARREAKPVPRPWASPSRHALGVSGEEEAA